MICPKCKVSNADIYAFCVECGTPLPKTPGGLSNEPSKDFDSTVIMPSNPGVKQTPPVSKEPPQDFDATLFMPEKPGTKEPPPPVQTPPKDFDATVFNVPQNSGVNETPPTVHTPPNNLDATVFNVPNQAVPPKNLDATQYYSPANTHENETPPPTVFQSNQQYAPAESVETAVNPQFQMGNFETTPDDKKPPKKSKKVFWIAGIFLLLLAGGGGAAAYFLLNTPQDSTSYLLSDKHEPDKVLDFDNQNSQFLMVGANDNDFQTWQVTPDPDDKNYYRFVNRGLGIDESLEVIDNERDSSVMMAKSANDVGQLWTTTKVKGDYYRFTNQWLGDSKSLSHNKRYYYFVRLRDSKDTDSQLWKKTPAKNGGFYLTNKKNGNKISLEAISEGDFKDKLVMRRGNSDNHQWQIDSVGSDYFTLSTAQKSLSVSSDKKELVKMAASDSNSEQKWKMTPVGNDYFRLTNESLGEGKSLEAVTYSKFDISMVKTSDEDTGQLWKMERK